MSDPGTGLVHDTGIELVPDHTRVVTRLFVPGREDVGPGDSRAAPVMDRILALDDTEVATALADLDARFGSRHRHLHGVFATHAERLASRMPLSDEPISDSRRLLIGATFTHEYSIEGAALCNPSIVALSSDVDGTVHFVVSVRGIGEGHRSSIGFRTGSIDPAGLVSIDVPGPYPVLGESAPAAHHLSVFRMLLHDLDDDHENAGYVLDALDARFTDDALVDRTVGLQAEHATRRNVTRTMEHLDRIASSSYQVTFPQATALSERVLWPHAPAEAHGMEDARFVQFTHDDGTTTYYATYTAFDGVNIAQHLIHTDDFATFEMSPMAGAAALGKGLALFPRTIHGQYVALSRSDRETNSVAFSDDLRCWPSSDQIQSPGRTWDLLQLGNCGSPIETAAGWLVLTHGVGAMRTYALGVLLLDLDDPRIVLAASDGPIMTPDARRRDGYVPNVLYTCGGLAVDDTLVLPYGVGDQTIGVATMSISQLLDGLVPTDRG